MSFELYKVLHLFGIFLMIASLGANLGFAMNGGTKGDNRVRKLMGMGHGLGMIIILVTGFGMLAQLGIIAPAEWGGWVHAKITIWFILGAAVALVFRGAAMSRALWVIVPILATMAGWIALTKPF